jgi:hypothetical protein
VTGGADHPDSLTGRALDAVLGAPHGALIFTRTTCPACGAYQAEIAALQAQGRLGGLAVGVLRLDRPGASRFKRENRWLTELRYLPYTVLYRRGQRIDAFAASRGAYLLERVAAAFGPAADPPGCGRR